MTLLYNEAAERFVEYMEVKNYSSETIKGYKKNMRMFNDYLESKNNCEIFIEDITKQDVDKYLKYLQEVRKLKPTSRNRYMYAISSLLNYCHKEGYIHENPAVYLEKAKEEKKERVYLNESEVARLLENISHPVGKATIIFMIETGVRISEACSLTFSQLDLENQLVRINGKGSKQRTIPLSNKLCTCLDDYIKNVRMSDTENVFATNKTGAISRQYCQMLISKATKKAKINKHVTCHTLRHTFATGRLDKGVNLVLIQKLLGHEDLSTTAIYMHTNTNELREAVNL